MVGWPLIQIPCNADNLCCSRAIGTVKAHIDNHPQWNSIRQGRTIKTRLAQQLHQQANVPEGPMCRKPEWDKFQNHLDPEYELLIYSRDYFNTNVYIGPHMSEKQIYLYHAANHFFVITSMPGF